MSLLDATLGGVSANSYGSVEDADAYFENKFVRDRWEALSNRTKSVALMEATEVLEGFRYVGVAAGPNQALAFPRVFEPASDGQSIPRPIRHACFLLALELATRSSTGAGEQAAKVAEMRAANVARFRVADYEVTFSGDKGVSAWDTLPDVVRTLVLPWIRKGSRVIGKRCGEGLYPSSLPRACR